MAQSEIDQRKRFESMYVSVRRAVLRAFNSAIMGGNMLVSHNVFFVDWLLGIRFLHLYRRPSVHITGLISLDFSNILALGGTVMHTRARARALNRLNSLVLSYLLVTVGRDQPIGSSISAASFDQL